MADHGHRDRLPRVGDDLGALFKHGLRVLGLQADQLLAALRHEIRTGEAANADEIGLLLADRPVQPGIVRRHGAVRVLADDDVALLGAQHVHRLGAVGAGAMLLALGPQRFPDGLAVIGQHVDLEAAVAGERHAEKPCRHAADLALAHRHVRHRLVRQVDVLDQRLDDLARVGALHGDHRPLLGNGGQPDVELRELGLEIVFHVVHDAGGAARRGGDVEAVGRQAADNAVIIDETVLAQHDAIAAAAGLELLPRVGVEQFHEFRGVGPDDLDLAERRGVEQAGRLAHRAAFSVDRGVHVLARPGEVPGALPLADVFEHGAVLLGPTMRRSSPRRVEQRPAAVVDDGAEGDRRIGRAEGGQPDLRNVLAECLGGDRQAVHVGGLALVGGHAVGGEALDVLDRAHALANGKADVLGGDVVLEVDEGLDRAVGSCARTCSEHAAGKILAGIGLGLGSPGHAAARFLCRLRAGGPCLVERRGEAVGAAAGADGDAVLRIVARQEALGGVVEDDLAARLREEMHRWRPARRDQQRVDRNGTGSTAALGLHGHRRDPELAADADDAAAVMDVDAEGARLVDQRAGRVVAQVDDRRDADARLLEVERRRIGGIIGRVDADIATDGYTVMIEVGARRRGQHDARPVVVGKHHVTLNGAGGEDDALRPHLPQPFARQALRVGEMLGDALGEANEILRVVAESGRARQDGDIVHGREFRDAGLRPGPAVLAVDGGTRLVAHGAAEIGLLVAQDDTDAGFGRGKRRRDASGAAAEHQHLAMRVARRVVIGVGKIRRNAEARRRADDRLVEALPGRLRPHEGLVVEAGREHRRGDVVDGADVEFERRPAVLRMRGKPLIELLYRGADIGRLARRIALDRDQRVGLLGTCRQDAARAVILERTADEMHAIGKQRRGQRVTGKAGIGLAVEAEAGRARRQPAAAGYAEVLRHFAAPLPAGLRRGRLTLS